MTDQVRQAIGDVLAGHGLNLYDLELSGTLVRVSVDRPGGVDLDALAEANKAVSVALDALDPIAGRYTLEVSSPGVERRLRTPEHFAGALGQTVSIRVRRPDGQVERVHGQLVAAGDQEVVVEGPEVAGGTARVPYEEIDRARTVFEWKTGSARSPSRGQPAGKGSQGTRARSTERVRTP